MVVEDSSLGGDPTYEERTDETESNDGKTYASVAAAALDVVEPSGSMRIVSFNNDKN